MMNSKQGNCISNLIEIGCKSTNFLYSDKIFFAFVAKNNAFYFFFAWFATLSIFLRISSWSPKK